MAWIALTTTDILEEFTPQEQASLQTIQAGTTQLAAILTKAINEARSAIQGGGNDLDADGTLPGLVLPSVVSIARWRFLVSFPKLKGLQTEERRDAYRDGLKLLGKIASGSPKVERPANAIATTGEIVNFPSVGKRPHRFGHRDEDGI